MTKEMTILLGIALVFSCQALLALVQYRASTESLQQIVFWSMGLPHARHLAGRGHCLGWP